MRWNRALLGASLCHRAIAAPGFAPIGIVPSFRNTTVPQPTATASCDAKCVVEYPPLSAIQWIHSDDIVYTEKVVVATVTIQIVTSANFTVTTKTTTNYDNVRGYSLYQFGANEQGTAELTLTIPQSDGFEYTSTLTYPTPYLDYYKEYHWQGVLPTYDKDFSSICATATEPANVPLPSHPQYPQPKGEFGPGKADPSGAGFQPLYVPAKDEPNGYWFQLEFSSEAAFSSCESSAVEVKIPTQYEAPLFITETTTETVSQSSAGLVIVQPTATGFEVTTSEHMATPAFPHVESTATSFDLPGPSPTTNSNGRGETPLQPNPPVVVTPPKTPVAHIMSSATDFGPGRPSAGNPQGEQSNDGRPPTPSQTSQNFGDAIASIINNNPQFFPPGTTKIQAASQVNPITPAPAEPFAPAPTPVFTFVPTVINGQSTTVPAFILPGSSTSSTATLGQTVTFNGQTTVLSAPPAFFTEISTTINGVATQVPAFIIDGTSTASLGQTVTLADGQTTVLSAPPALFTMVPTTINGVATSVPAYLIDGTSTASLGQTVTLADGQTTVLSAPPALFTMVPTTINGVATSVPAYLIDGTSTASLGQTVTLPNGQTTVLSLPTATLSWVSTTDAFGNPTSVPVYLVDGTSTATAGETLVLSGSTVVVPTATATLGVISGVGGPVSTGGVAASTSLGGGKGAGGRVEVGWLGVGVGFGFGVLSVL